MIFREEDNARKMRVNDMIALCHVFDDYDIFNTRLLEFISSKCNRNDVYNLYRVSHSETVIGAKKAKKFYRENKSVIDEINQYTSISDFINSNYYVDGSLRENSCLDFLCQYLNLHKDEMPNILLVLQKIEKLGFRELLFDEKLDFTSTKYEICIDVYDNYDYVYLDNMQALSNYQDNIVEYKTNESNYRIVIKQLWLKYPLYDSKIAVNSLVFDSSRLPDKVSKESIFDKIVGLKEEQKDNCTAIQNSVDLSVGVDDLYSQFSLTRKIVEELKNFENKEEARQILLKMNTCLDELQTLSTQYDDSISQDDSVITKEQLKKEKTKYLERRRSMRWDDC